MACATLSSYTCSKAAVYGTLTIIIPLPFPRTKIFVKGKHFSFSFLSLIFTWILDTSFEKGKCWRTSKKSGPILYKNMRKIVLEFGLVVFLVQYTNVFVPKSVQSIFHPASARLLCRKDDVFPCHHLTDRVSRARLSESAMFRSALVAAVAGSAAAFAPTAPLAGRATTRAVGTFLCCALPCSPPAFESCPENPACTGRGLSDARPVCPDWGPRPFAPLSHNMFPATKSVHGCRN